MPNQSQISTWLRKNGPTLTRELISALTKTEGISAGTARKRIQRAREEYKCFEGVNFEKNAQFIYLENQYGTRQFWEKFEEACYRGGKSYWNTIVTLKSRGGVIPFSLFPRVSGAAVMRKSQLSPQEILDRLSGIGLLEIFEETENKCIRFKPRFYPRIPLSHMRANELAEKIALLGVKDWARKIGFGSYNKFGVRYEPETVVSGISWDLSAPSYIRPLLSFRNGAPLPGFIVCDINLTCRVIEENEAEAFIGKCNLATSTQEARPILPMMLGYHFTREALSLLKGKGILAVVLKDFFGDELSEALQDLVKMLTDIGERISVNPDRLIAVMDNLSKIEGAANNLRGDLFELIMGMLAKDIEVGDLKTGELRRDPITGRSVEIDVQIDRGYDKGILVIECKAKNSRAMVSENDIRKWYKDRVPLIFSILNNDQKSAKKPIHFELWSNGQFVNSGSSWLRQQKTNLEKYTVGWKDGEKLKAYARKANNYRLRKMLNEHYFKSATGKSL